MRLIRGNFTTDRVHVGSDLSPDPPSKSELKALAAPPDGSFHPAGAFLNSLKILIYEQLAMRTVREQQ
jgi:hypothetical protein